MNCQGAREQTVDTLATGRVEMTREVAGHIQSCAECRTFYAQQDAFFRAMDSGLGAMVNESVPLSLLPRVRARMAETHTVSPWFYRLLPAAAVLVIACLIVLPLVRRSSRSRSVQVAVIPERSENGGEPRRPLAEQPEESTVPRATRELSPRHSARPPAAQRRAQAAEVAVLVSPEESRGLLQLAETVRQRPHWAQAMLAAGTPPPVQMETISPIETADLKIAPLEGGN